MQQDYRQGFLIIFQLKHWVYAHSQWKWLEWPFPPYNCVRRGLDDRPSPDANRVTLRQIMTRSCLATTPRQRIGGPWGIYTTNSHYENQRYTRLLQVNLSIYLYSKALIQRNQHRKWYPSCWHPGDTWRGMRLTSWEQYIPRAKRKSFSTMCNIFQCFIIFSKIMTLSYIKSPTTQVMMKNGRHDLPWWCQSGHTLFLKVINHNDQTA